jgi:tripartite-type tricarboxylate transporter receptor subunit TctC
MMQTDDPGEGRGMWANRLIAGILAALAALPVLAQQGRPIELVVPAPPGGFNDVTARILQPSLSAQLGAPVVVISKPGANFVIGTDYVAKGAANALAVGLLPNAPITIATAMKQPLPYQLNDLVAVGIVCADVSVITAARETPFGTLEEMVEFARRNPGKLTYASAGQGSVNSLAMEMIKQVYKLDITHVPYQGSGPARTAVLGGHTALGATGLSPMLTLLRSGEVKGIVTTAAGPVPGLPNMPTMAAKGFPEASLNLWLGIFVSSRAPRETLDRLGQSLARTMKEPAVVSQLEKAGLIVDYRDAAGAAKLIEAELRALRSLGN